MLCHELTGHEESGTGFMLVVAPRKVRSQTKKLRKTRGVQMADSYGFGFVVGLKDAYMAQQKEENWALVLAVPEKVNQAADKLIVRIFPKKMVRPKVNGTGYPLQSP